jgi:hypothetical protein
MQEFYTFLKSTQNSASFDTLCTQFRKKTFSTLIRLVLFFWKLKDQLRSKLFNIFKTLFFKLVLGFHGQTKIT